MTQRGDEPDPVDPAEHLLPLVGEATVRIHGTEPGHPLYGSGFFVAPNWVLTCAHVACRTPEETGADDREEAAVGQPAARKVTVGWGDRMLDGVVEWAEPPAAGEDAESWPAPDLALVRLLDAVDHPCVWLSERTAKAYPTNQVAFSGWTLIDGEIESYDGRCTITGQVRTTGALRLGNEDEVPYGVSGGPVVDLVRGEVIGVVKARRKARDGGLAVGIQHLRRLPRTPEDDLYHRVMSAHDLHHADRHAFVQGAGETWTDAQSEIGACAGRALTAGRRTQLLGLLAQLPPPADTPGLMKIVAEVRGEPALGLPHAPRTWRDGLGLLYDLRRGTTETEAVLRFAVHAATADRTSPADEAAERAVWKWAEEAASSAEGLSRFFRSTLVAERLTRLRVRATSGVDLTPAQWRGPEALLEIVPRGWERDLYDWRVSVVEQSGEVDCIEEEHQGTRLGALPERLREPLREAFFRCDAGGNLATLQLAVPAALIALAADDWPLGPAGGALSAERPVVIRRTDPPEEERAAAADRLARWQALHQQRPRPDLLDCDEGTPGPLPGDGDLRARPRDTLPVLCRSAATAPDALNRIVLSGYNVALWRREPVEPDTVCADFHRGVHRTVRVAKTAGRLPGLLAGLRAAVADRVPESYWSAGLTILYDDPTRPVAGADELEAPGDT